MKVWEVGIPGCLKMVHVILVFDCYWVGGIVPTYAQGLKIDHYSAKKNQKLFETFFVKIGPYMYGIFPKKLVNLYGKCK